MKTINDFFTSPEAAFRWDVPMNALQEKLKPSRQGDKLVQWQKEGLLKCFIEPGKQRATWIISREFMEMFYGEEPKKETWEN